MSNLFFKMGCSISLTLLFFVSCSSSVKKNSPVYEKETINIPAPEKEITNATNSGKEFQNCTFPEEVGEAKQCEVNWNADKAKILSKSCEGDPSDENICRFKVKKNKSESMKLSQIMFGWNKMQYALCSTAICNLDTESTSQNPMAICPCDFFDGTGEHSRVSISLKASLPEDSHKVLSNFSMINSPDNNKIPVCDYGKKSQQYADCFGAICEKVDSESGKQSLTCYCPIKEATEFVSLTGGCDDKTLYSAVSARDFQLTGTIMVYKHFGIGPPPQDESL